MGSLWKSGSILNIGGGTPGGGGGITIAQATNLILEEARAGNTDPFDASKIPFEPRVLEPNDDGSYPDPGETTVGKILAVESVGIFYTHVTRHPATPNQANWDTLFTHADFIGVFHNADRPPAVNESAGTFLFNLSAGHWETVEHFTNYSVWIDRTPPAGYVGRFPDRDAATAHATQNGSIAVIGDEVRVASGFVAGDPGDDEYSWEKASELEASLIASLLQQSPANHLISSGHIDIVGNANAAATFDTSQVSPFLSHDDASALFDYIITIAKPTNLTANINLSFRDGTTQFASAGSSLVAGHDTVTITGQFIRSEITTDLNVQVTISGSSDTTEEIRTTVQLDTYTVFLPPEQVASALESATSISDFGKLTIRENIEAAHSVELEVRRLIAETLEEIRKDITSVVYVLNNRELTLSYQGGSRTITIPAAANLLASINFNDTTKILTLNRSGGLGAWTVNLKNPAPNASEVLADATGFTGRLLSTDDEISLQSALETLDAAEDGDGDRAYTTLYVDTTERTSPVSGSSGGFRITLNRAPAAGKQIQLVFVSGSIVDNDATDILDKYESVSDPMEFDVDFYLGGNRQVGSSLNQFDADARVVHNIKPNLHFKGTGAAIGNIGVIVGRTNDSGSEMQITLREMRYESRFLVLVREFTIQASTDGGEGGSGLGDNANTGPWLKESEVTGTADAVIFTTDPPVTAYDNNIRYVYQAEVDQNAGFTIDLDGIGAKSVVRHDGTAIEAGDIPDGFAVALKFDLANDRWIATNVGDDPPDVIHSGHVFVRSATEPTANAANFSVNILGMLVMPSGHLLNDIPSGTDPIWSLQVEWSTDGTVTVGTYIPVGTHALADIPVAGLTDGQQISVDGLTNLRQVIQRIVSNVPRRPHEIVWDSARNPLGHADITAEAQNIQTWQPNTAIPAGDAYYRIPDGEIWRTSGGFTTGATFDKTDSNWFLVVGMEDPMHSRPYMRIGRLLHDARVVVDLPDDFDLRNWEIEVGLRMAHGQNGIGFLVGMGLPLNTFQPSATQYHSGVQVFHDTRTEGQLRVGIRDDTLSNNKLRSQGTLTPSPDFAALYGTDRQEVYLISNQDSYPAVLNRDDFTLKMQYRGAERKLYWYWSADVLNNPTTRFEYEYAADDDPYVQLHRRFIIEAYANAGNLDYNLRLFKLAIRELHQEVRF